MSSNQPSTSLHRTLETLTLEACGGSASEATALRARVWAAAVADPAIRECHDHREFLDWVAHILPALLRGRPTPLRDLAATARRLFADQNRGYDESDASARIRDAIRALPVLERAVATDHFESGLGAVEIAANTGMPEAAARQLLYRATRALRVALGGSVGQSKGGDE